MAVSLRDADEHRVDPHAPMSQAALDEAHRAAFVELEEEQREKDTELDAIYHDFAYAHGWRAFEDRLNYKRLKHGRYHFLNNNPFKQTESGLLIPNNE